MSFLLVSDVCRWFEEAARKGKSITPNPAVTTVTEGEFPFHRN